MPGKYPVKASEQDYEDMVEPELGDVNRAHMYVLDGITGEPGTPCKNDKEFPSVNDPYNCLGWVLYNGPKYEGYLQWEDMPNQVKDVTKLMESAGYKLCAAGEPSADADLLGLAENKKLAHIICRYIGSYDGILSSLPRSPNGNTWESKLSGFIRVTHPRTVMNRVVLASYKME